MESVRKNDCEADRSDDSSQDNENSTNRTALHVILNKLTLPAQEMSGWSFERGFLPERLLATLEIILLSLKIIGTII